MKYFLDTEFLEGTQKGIFNTKPTIDLISIGIVCEDGREYYAISKDFNLKEAWNRWQPEYDDVYVGDGKNYWIRENVLKPIYNELVLHHTSVDWYYKNPHLGEKVYDGRWLKFNYKSLKWLINKYGKTNKQIAEEIIEFTFPTFKILKDGRCNCNCGSPCSNHRVGSSLRCSIDDLQDYLPKFYGYYSDYDWVVFCWLFGKMIDLPKGFPMYCIDLKQTMDEIIKRPIIGGSIFGYKTIEDLKNDSNYPKQTNEHNSLSDAKWTYELYKFLNTL